MKFVKSSVVLELNDKSYGLYSRIRLLSLLLVSRHDLLLGKEDLEEDLIFFVSDELERSADELLCMSKSRNMIL